MKLMIVMIVVCLIANIFYLFLYFTGSVSLGDSLLNVGFYSFCAYIFFFRSYKRLNKMNKNTVKKNIK